MFRTLVAVFGLIQLFCGVAATAHSDLVKTGDRPLECELLNAVEVGNQRKIHELLVRGASARSKFSDGTPVLVGAAVLGDVPTMKDLLDHGARINERGLGGETALMVASAKLHEDAVKLLLKRGAKSNMHSSNCYTALTLCVEKNQIQSGSQARDRAYAQVIKLLELSGHNKL